MCQRCPDRNPASPLPDAETRRTYKAVPHIPAASTGSRVQVVRGRKKFMKEKYMADREKPRKKFRKKLFPRSFRNVKDEARKPVPLKTKKNSRSERKRYSMGGL